MTVELKGVFEDLKEQIKSLTSDEIVRENLSVPWQADIVVGNKGEEGTCSSNDLKENKEAINVTEQVEVDERQNANEGKEVSDVKEAPVEAVMDSI